MLSAALHFLRHELCHEGEVHVCFVCSLGGIGFTAWKAQRHGALQLLAKARSGMHFSTQYSPMRFGMDIRTQCGPLAIYYLTVPPDQRGCCG